LRKHCCRGEALNITYSECVSVAVFMQPAMRMRRIVLSSLVCPVLPYFPTYHKRHDFRENVNEYKLYAFVFSTTFV